MRASKGAALAVALLALPGCAIVEVRVEGERPRLSVWPLGVNIARGQNDAISVSQTVVGLWSGCGAAGAGVGSVDCIRIDARTCGVAVVERPSPLQRGLLAKLSDQTRAECLRETKGDP